MKLWGFPMFITDHFSEKRSDCDNVDCGSIFLLSDYKKYLPNKLGVGKSDAFRAMPTVPCASHEQRLMACKNVSFSHVILFFRCSQQIL